MRATRRAAALLAAAALTASLAACGGCCGYTPTDVANDTQTTTFLEETQ